MEKHTPSYIYTGTHQHTHRHTDTDTHTHTGTHQQTHTQTGTIIHAVAPVKPMRLGDTEIEKDKIGTAIA
jgi:hypothetical protein